MRIMPLLLVILGLLGLLFPQHFMADPSVMSYVIYVVVIILGLTMLYRQRKTKRGHHDDT